MLGLLRTIDVTFRVESLNSVTNFDVSDTDGVELIFFSGSFITKHVHLYFNSNLHTVSICDVRVRDRVLGLGSAHYKIVGLQHHTAMIIIQ